MFLYKISSIDKLLTVVKNRDYVLNNPALCKLLENPLIKDDTELAILYNEYKLNYPDSGKKFVDYFYTHAPELDTGSVVEWVKKIKNDPELYEYGKENDLKIDQIWTEKQKKGDNYSWLGDLYDCLSKPCQYMGNISPIVGTIGDTQAKYSNKNTNGSDNETTLLGIPMNIANKVPKYLLQGMMQLTDMISNQSQDVLQVLKRDSKGIKEDPYVIKRAELIGGDILSDIASKMGDCFRLYEHSRRFNPYDYDQNKEQADKFGTVVYDEHGNPRTVTPNGNPMYKDVQSRALSDNRRLSTSSTAQDIMIGNLPNLDPNTMSVPFKVTIYNGMFDSEKNFYYGDLCTDSNGDIGNSANPNYRIVPTSPSGARAMAKQNILVRTGCAIKPIGVVAYFQALIAKKYPGLSIAPNLQTLAKDGYQKGGLYVVLFFPTGQQILPAIDTGDNANIHGKFLCDITAQWFMTKNGMKVGQVITSDHQPIKTLAPVSDPFDSALFDGFKPIGKGLAAVKIYGSDGSNNVNGAFFFGDDFCEKRGLDKKVYGYQAPAKLISPISKNNSKDDHPEYDEKNLKEIKLADIGEAEYPDIK